MSLRTVPGARKRCYSRCVDRLRFLGRGLLVASGLVVLGAACGFGVDTDGLFGGASSGASGDGGPLDGDTADGAIPKVQVLQIGVGDEFACGRRADGTVMCWGAKDDGRLGDGKDKTSSQPVLVKDMNDATDLSVGDDHACVVRKTGEVYCWGQNDKRQLGDGTTSDAVTPRPVVMLGDATQVAAGGEFSCALKKDATVVCWGENGDGQLGDNTTNDRSNPMPVMGVVDATQVTASFATACALVKSGDVYCWGDNDQGTVGNNALPTDQKTAVKIDGLSGVVALGHGATANHFCAVLGTGGAKCWGEAESGRIGHGKSEDYVKVPTAVTGLNDAAKITMGDSFTCALRKTGGLSCWGNNSWHQLGIGDMTNDGTSSPVSLDTLSSGIDQVAAGGDFACALHTGGDHISCWGSNRDGTLGRNTRLQFDTPLVVNGVNATAIGAGREHVCVVTNGGGMSCWGMNNTRQQSETTYEAKGSPTTLGAVSGAERVYGGEIHTCALFGTDAKCWGHASNGEIGDGKPLTYIQPDPQPFAAGGPVNDLALGYLFTCAALASGQVVCAGYNDDGRLGSSGPNTSSPRPVLVPNPAATDAGVDSGDPDAGDGGDAGVTPPPPSMVPLANVTGIGSGRLHVCAIHDGGKVSCWGTAYSGRLGVNTSDPQVVPVNVDMLPPATQITGGYDHTCALLNDGSIRCWGANGYGQVSGGGGDGAQLRTPNLAGKMAKQIAAGGNHTCALFTDGTVACWGRGQEGQLGNGGRSDVTQPTPVKDLTGVKAIAANAEFTCAIKDDGSTLCWGTDRVGELGDGVLLISGTPAAVYGY